MKIKHIALSILMLFPLVFINAALAKEERGILYNRGGFVISHKKATYQGRVLYDASGDLKALFKREGRRLEGAEYYYTPLSLIGTYFSYEQDFYDEGGSGTDARVPNNSIIVKTVDIRSNRSVSILALVDEDSLVAAAKGDSWVREHAGDLEQLDDCRSFKEILEIDGLGDDLGNQFSENSFAFFAFDRRTGRAALRLMRQDYMGFSHNRILQLGLWVRPKKGMEKVFGLKGNFFMEKR